MRLSALLVAALLLPLLAVPHVAAAGTPILAARQAGDSDLGRPLAAVNAPLRFIDGDGDNLPSIDEPAYWDLDDSSTVSVADLRLRPFLSLQAGTEVAITDADAGRDLKGASAWFGTAAGAWYADLDASRTVTPGDTRLGETATVVAASAAEIGQPLALPQGAMGAGSIGLDDADSDRRRDRGEAVYIDLDTASTQGPPIVGIGDLRLMPLARPGSSGGSGAAGGNGASDGIGFAADGDSGGLRGFDVVVLALLAINLLGLVYVVRVTRNGRPRNPFK